MARSRILAVSIVTDATKAAKGTQQALSTYEKFKGGVERLAIPAAIAGAALIKLGTDAVKSASRQEQAYGGLEAVFGKNAQTVKRWAKTSADAVGLSRSEYSEFAAVVGAQLKNLGVPMDQVMSGTQDMISLGADLAATFGGSTSDAVNALSAALRGEADPAERYGLSLNQTRINAYLAERGLKGLKGTALTQAKAQAVMALATEQAGGAIGQFARESDTAAGSAQINAARWENVRATLGTALLPIVTKVTQAFAGIAGWMEKNSTLVLIVVGVIGALAAAILVLNVAMKIQTAIQWAQNAAFLASPITWIVLGIIALVAAVVLIATKTKWFQQIWAVVWGAVKTAAAAVWNWLKAAGQAVMQALIAYVRLILSPYVAVFNGIKTVVAAVFNWIRTGGPAQALSWLRSAAATVAAPFANAFNAIKAGGAAAFNGLLSVARTVLNGILAPIRGIQSAFNAVVSAIRSVVDWIGRLRFPSPPSWLTGLFGRALPTGAQLAPAGLSRGLSATATIPTWSPVPNLAAMTGGITRGGDIISIEVTGALDPDAVARQIRSLLTGRDRRTAGVTIDRRVR